MGEEVAYNVDIQLAENEEVDVKDIPVDVSEYEKKRKLLKKTKIVKQTWSILEIFQKVKEGKLQLNPEYQRNVIWDKAKKTAFVESLFMGIIIPPVYVVEIPGENILEENTYEVVDGKQRLSTINEFIMGSLILQEKSLEYYPDWFAGRSFSAIREDPSATTYCQRFFAESYLKTFFRSLIGRKGNRADISLSSVHWGYFYLYGVGSHL